MVQSANPTEYSVTIKGRTLIVHITPVTVVPQSSVYSVVDEMSSEGKARKNYNTVALTKAFAESTFDAVQRSQVLDLCAKYQHVFSLLP